MFINISEDINKNIKREFLYVCIDLLAAIAVIEHKQSFPFLGVSLNYKHSIVNGVYITSTRYYTRLTLLPG